jgi:osmotically-inducible protein OsmY
VARINLASIAILAVALLIGCAKAPVDDAAIKKNVKAKLAAEFGPFEDNQLRQEERGADKQTINYISVNSINGVVTLTGEVRGNKAKTKAGEIARGVDQVVSVTNNLSLAPGYSDDAVGDKPSQ